jgi:hypothetical protein
MKKRVDFSKYKGEWVLLCEDKVVAHSKNLMELENEIGKCKSVPTLTKIPRMNLIL